MQSDLKLLITDADKKGSHETMSVLIGTELSLKDRTKTNILRVLSEDDWHFWIHEGYIVVKNAISKAQAKKTAAFVWEFEDKAPHDSSTWYTSPRAKMEMEELVGSGMVEVYNHPILWENR